MRFYVGTVFMDTREAVEIAKAADDLGYDGIAIADHVVNLETLSTPYPYTDDGKPRWEPFTQWPDPWVLIGAMAAVTSRVEFVTTVYVAALRNPYLAAKSIATASYLAQGRLNLGVGVGWCEDEFALMGQDFANRGRRTDEMLELMKQLWAPGWTEFEGRYYSTPRLEMEPSPPRIPIFIGGQSDIALRRAAGHDGWIGDLLTSEQVFASIRRIAEIRAENGLGMDDYTVITPLADGFTPDHYARAAEAGVSAILTAPWMFYCGPDATLAEKIDGLRRFRVDNELD